MSEYLDRAIRAGEDAAKDGSPIGEHWTHTFLKGAIRELLKDVNDNHSEYWGLDLEESRGWDAALAEIRRRAGIGEG